MTCSCSKNSGNSNLESGIVYGSRLSESDFILRKENVEIQIEVKCHGKDSKFYLPSYY